MVARPPVRVRIEPMQLADLPSIHAIEEAAFSAPWPADAYRNELEGESTALELALAARLARIELDLLSGTATHE